MDSTLYVLSAGLEFFFAVVSLILFVGCLFDHERGRRTDHIFMIILAVHALMNVVDACVWLWCDVPELVVLMKVLCFLSYALGHAIFVLFTYLLVCYLREYAPVPMWVTKGIAALSALALALWVLSLFNGMYYYWDENGVCKIGDWFFVSQVFAVFFLSFNIALVLRCRRALPKRDCGVLVLYSAVPLISCAFVPLWDVVPLYTASTISLLLYYAAIHVEHGQRVAEQRIRLAQQEMELQSSRTAVMLSQIRPHFLYNTLTAIAQLCESDPRKAKATTLYFAEYLRSNMNALNQKGPIPFEKELEHVRTYLAIEQVRFADALAVTYDIQATDFLLPPLCLQPLVENAVKHGVGMKEDGGAVFIGTRAYADRFEITVRDDGVGFDPARPPQDGKPHIGIQNVRERLKQMMDAELDIVSAPGRGAVVTIRLPRKGQDA
ncbi:MAG: histidine kinase [Eubacteriales bacterium]|nr:histidine kinase [Eubacteriales bacterium]